MVLAGMHALGHGVRVVKLVDLRAARVLALLLLALAGLGLSSWGIRRGGVVAVGSGEVQRGPRTASPCSDGAGAASCVQAQARERQLRAADGARPRVLLPAAYGLRMSMEGRARLVPGHTAAACESTYDRHRNLTLPRFMLIGGLKTGSTYLHNVLAMHPSLVGSSVKEHYFFADNELEKETEGGGGKAALEALGALFPPPPLAEEQGGPPARLPFFSPAGELRNPASAPRVADLFPCMKFVVVLREPIARAWSHFQMSIREKVVPKEWVSLFEMYLWQEMAILYEEMGVQLEAGEGGAADGRGRRGGEGRRRARGDDGAGPEDNNFNVSVNVESLALETLRECLGRKGPDGRLPRGSPGCSVFDYTGSPAIQLMLSRPAASLVLDGLYSEPLLYWLQYFPRAQFHFIKTEELFARPREVLSGVHAFLGVGEHAYDDQVLKTPVLVWGGINGHTSPGDYGKPEIDDLDGVQRFFRIFSGRLREITGVSWGYPPPRAAAPAAAAGAGAGAGAAARTPSSSSSAPRHPLSQVLRSRAPDDPDHADDDWRRDKILSTLTAQKAAAELTAAAFAEEEEGHQAAEEAPPTTA
jgi:hypothetical protein